MREGGKREKAREGGDIPRSSFGCSISAGAAEAEVEIMMVGEGIVCGFDFE